MTNQRKTFKDYLFEGGVKGRFFLGEGFRGIKFCYTIEQLEILTDNLGNDFLIGRTPEYKYTVNLYLKSHLDDIEASPEEVQRAKEGQLAKKTA